MNRKNLKRKRPAARYYQDVGNTNLALANTTGEYQGQMYYHGNQNAPAGNQQMQGMINQNLINEKARLEQQAIESNLKVNRSFAPSDAILSGGQAKGFQTALKSAGGYKNAGKLFTGQAAIAPTAQIGTAAIPSVGTVGTAGYTAAVPASANFAPATAGQAGINAGAGWGTVASLVGKGLDRTKFGDDQDPTTYKFSEGFSDVLDYGGQGAAWGSMFGAPGTAIGAVAGSLYGIGKGLFSRKKARTMEKDHNSMLNRLNTNLDSLKMDQRSNTNKLYTRSSSGQNYGLNTMYS